MQLKKQSGLPLTPWDYSCWTRTSMFQEDFAGVLEALLDAQVPLLLSFYFFFALDVIIIYYYYYLLLLFVSVEWDLSTKVILRVRYSRNTAR
jgi:hypothetical protein